MTRSPSADSSTCVATWPAWSCACRDRRVYSCWKCSTVSVIGTIDTATTTPSGQYITSRIVVMTVICRMLSNRNVSPKDMNRRMVPRSFMIRDNSCPDCQPPWNDIGRICRRAYRSLRISASTPMVARDTSQRRMNHNTASVMPTPMAAAPNNHNPCWS